MKMFKGLMESIKKSVKDRFGKESSARISSYIVLVFIIFNSLVFTVIEIVNAIVMWSKGDFYIIPTEHIWIFGLILSHHLGLLFYKSREFTGKNEFVSKPNVEEVKESINKEEKVVDNDLPIEEYPDDYNPEEG